MRLLTIILLLGGSSWWAILLPNGNAAPAMRGINKDGNIAGPSFSAKKRFKKPGGSAGPKLTDSKGSSYKFQSSVGSKPISTGRGQKRPVGDHLKKLKQLADAAGRNLSALFNNATQRSYYQRKYQCSLIPIPERKDDCDLPIDPEREDRPKMMAYLVKTNGRLLVQNVSAELESKMRQKMDAVKRSVKAAEQAYVDYKEDDSIKGITYFNAKRINRPHMIDKYYTESNPYRNFTLHFDTHFKADVNLTHSVVHVPTNVFDGSSEINNGAKWTMRLNDIFVENREQDKAIYWQYFGSALGFYRVFPGSKWATSPDKVELFDCRTKGWYIQASCSPKDLVILLDSSGSMLGLRFRIAMNTVDQILKTLGEDDFFNIIKFDSRVQYVDQCFNGTLLQATAENKERLRRKIRDIDPKEMANVEKALLESFSLFNKTAQENVGSMCNRAIMLITDGIHDTYEKMFDKYNNFTETGSGMSQIRVFSFLIGQDAGYNRESNWMACRNKGYYVEIKTIAAVQDNMKQYVTTLARPLALADFNDVTWTNVYIDEAEYEYASAKKAGGRQHKPKKKKLFKSSMPDMRLMASVAAPVFDKKPDSSKQGLLGVIGTDLPIHFFNTFVAPPKLGVDAYAFAVNHNGFALFHPDYIPPFDAPDFTNVDVSKIEMPFSPWEWYNLMRKAYNDPIKLYFPNGTETELQVEKNDTAAATQRLISVLTKINATVPNYNVGLRTSMVQAETGHFWMKSLKTAESHSRPKIIGMHYYYTPIPETPFTLGIALAGDRDSTSDYGFVRMDAKIGIRYADMTVFAPREGLRTKIPSQWNYCYLSAEELEVTAEDYEEQLRDMYHEFEENYKNASLSEVPPDVLDTLDPSLPADIHCEILERQMKDSFTYIVNDTIVNNMTAINFHNITAFHSIDWFSYATEMNTTQHVYEFNIQKCVERVHTYHIEQIREDMQAWMFEKKFEQTLKEYIEKGKDGSVDFREKCDIEVIENLLFDAELTNDTITKLFNGVRYYNARYGVSVIFLATHSGLTRYVTPDHSESDFINTHPETIRESYYERAVQAGPDKIVVTFESHVPRSPKRVILAQALFVEHATTDGSLGRTVVAVAGMEIPARVLGELVVSQQCDNGRCHLGCGDTSYCYLLDDNGFVVSAEYDFLVGRSMAEVDPNLFFELTNYEEIIEDGPDAKKEPPKTNKETIWDSLYEMIIFDDYQATCPILKETSAAPFRLLNPFSAIFRTTFHISGLLRQLLASTFTIIFTTIRDSILSVRAAENIPAECLAFLKDGQVTDLFWNCTVSQTASRKFKIDKSDTTTKRPKILGQRVCNKRYNIYRLNEKATRLEGEIRSAVCHDCTNCSYATPSGFCFDCVGILNGTERINLTWVDMPNCKRTWRAQTVPKTNLVILVVDNWCVCERNQDVVKILTNKTLDYADDEEQCQLLKMPRDRRRPEKCASDNPMENVDVCGSAQRTCLPNSIWLMLIITTIISHHHLSPK